MNDPELKNTVPERPTTPPEEPHDYYPNTQKQLDLLVKIVWIALAITLVFALFKFIIK